MKKINPVIPLTLLLVLGFVINDFAQEQRSNPLTTGNVGIGVPNPQYRLDVDGTIRASSFMGDGSALTGTGDNMGNHIALQNLRLSGNWLSGDGGNEGIFITSTGKVGIGTTTPSEILEIKTLGATFVIMERNLNTLGGSIYKETGETESVWYFPFIRGWQGDNLIIRDEDALRDVMTFQNNTGRVGIGTTTPAVMLNINGGSDISLSGGGYFLVGDTAALNIGMDNNEIMSRNDGANSPLYLNREGGDVILNELAGNVGIGTDSPGHKLHVDGNLFVDGNVSFANDTAFITISPGDFVPEDESVNFENNGYELTNMSTTNASYFVAGLHLPDGANLLEFRSYWVDYTAYNGIITLRRMNLSDGSLQTICENISNGNSGNWLTRSTTTFNFSSEIDNSNYLYFLILFLEQSSGLHFHGLRIQYTYAKP